MHELSIALNIGGCCAGGGVAPCVAFTRATGVGSVAVSDGKVDSGFPFAIPIKELENPNWVSAHGSDRDSRSRDLLREGFPLRRRGHCFVEHSHEQVHLGTATGCLWISCAS